MVASAYIASTGGTKSTNVCDRGVIFNAGTININNSNIYAYGYVKGTGLINLNSGSAIDCMTTYDWPGGADAIGIYSKVLLTNGWSMHNISCTTNIYSGATYNGFIYVLIPTFSTQCQATAVVLGNASSNNCIFRTKSGYLVKSTTKADAWSSTHASYLALFSNVGSNQINGQRDVFELYGEFEDATLEINMKYNFIGERDIQLKTDTSKPATIGFMDIYIREGSTLKLANSDYAFLPGSTVQIDSGAKVEINNSNVDITIFSNDYFTSNADLKATSGSAAYYRICVDKKDAEFIVNGELNCNGKIGGYINTTADGAIMIIGSTASVTANYVLMAHNGGAKASSGSLTATANVGGTVTNIDKGTSGQAYVSVNNNGTYYWTLADNANKFYINLYDSDKETQLGDTLTLYSLDDTKEIPANINEPSKDFYNFVTWLNEDGTTFNGTVMSSGETITLYASWEEIEYSIEYSASEVDIDGNVLNTITDSVTFPQRATFTISDFVDGRLDLSTATYSNYYFDGWYAGYDKTIANKFPYLTTEMLLTLSNTFGETIPLYCEFCETRKYTIQFNIVGNSDMTIISDYQTTESSITLSSIEQVVSAQTIYDSYNKDKSYSKYFMGWYIEGNAFGINDTISLIDFADTDGNLVITVKWGNKYTVTITNDNTDRVEEITMTDTDGITYANNTYIVPGTKFKVYVKFSWRCWGTRTATITVGDWVDNIETSLKLGHYDGTYDGLTANGNVTVYATY